MPSHTHGLQLKYVKGDNKVYENYEKPQQAICLTSYLNHSLLSNDLNIQYCKLTIE
jgi:hypothetical protein